MFTSIRLASLSAIACALAVPATAAASDYNAGVLSDGPTLYWQLDETSGTTADNAATADGSGDGIVTDGSVLGGPGAFSLSSHAATLQGASAIATAVPSRALAVEFWVKPAAAGSGTFLTYGNAFELGYNAKRKLTLSVGGGNAKDTRVGLPLNRWTLVDVSLNTGSGADAQVFTNGGTWRVKTVKNVGVVAPNVPAGTVTLGGAIGGFDEFATYPNALTQAQTYSHYTRTALPLSTAAPTISGTPQSGQTLTAVAGSWSNATSTGLQWQRCDSADPAANACDDIAGATGTTYRVEDEHVGSYISVTESSANANGVGAVDSVAVGPVTTAPLVDAGSGGGTGTGTDRGTGTTTGTGTGTGGVTDLGAAGAGSTATGSTAQAGTTPTSRVASRCTVRLLKIAARKATIRGAGRLTVKVAKGKRGKVDVVASAANATKTRFAKVAFKLDRKTLKGKKGKLRRSFTLAGLKPGKHALRVSVRPRRGKARTIKLTLRVTRC
jgi:hypothetical protein